jgi:MFS family permease
MRVTRDLVPALPRAAWTLLGGTWLSALGTGLTLPFLLVYLHQVRGLELEVAALAVSTLAVAGLVGNPLGGWLADRLGPRNAVAAGLVIAAAGAFAVAAVREPWHAFAAAAVVGLGAAIVWPAQDALLATVVRPEQRSSAFAVHHALLNLGFGVGGLVAAALVQESAPESFELVYFLDGLSFLAFVPILLLTPALRSTREPATRRAGFREVLHDRLFLRVWALTALLVAVGYAQYHAAFPAYATRPGGLPLDQLGVALAVNTFVVAAVQLFTLRAMRGRRRTRGLALVAVAFSLAWVVTLAAGQLGGGPAALVVFSLAMALLALGETLVPPTLPPLVNELATEELRGRYNGVSTLAWTTGFIVGPAVAGVVLAVGQPEALFLGLSAGCAIVGVGALRLERRLPASANLVPALASE